jgi:DNA polymerase-3 subunit gamma/tau
MPNAGSGTTTFIPSLKNLGNAPLAPEADEEDPYIKGDAKDDYTMDSFLKCWVDYAARIKAEGKSMGLVTVLTANAPVMLSPNQFEVVVNSKTLETSFRDEKPFLLNYLRTTLRNFDIDVNTRIDEQAVTKRPYTASEKFQHMASKNPQLTELKRRFNLDFD